VEEARAVLARLERIDALDRARADPAVVLGELRELVREAEVWARRERDARAASAVEGVAERVIGCPSAPVSPLGASGTLEIGLRWANRPHPASR
jgi:hypothetical protein